MWKFGRRRPKQILPHLCTTFAPHTPPNTDMLKSYLYTFLFLALFPMDAESQLPKQVEKHTITGNWKFKQADTPDWLDIDLPSSVHTALLKHGKIENPFYRDNEEKVQWIETKDWEYEVRFDVPADVFAKEHIDLKCGGLDTYAQVFLNDTLIFDANNMFRTWQKDVKPWLKPTENVLHIYFESPVNKPKAEWDALGYVLPGGIRTMTRKAQYHYGWDWGPKLTGCGMFKKPELVGWNDFIIDDFRVTMRSYTPEKAVMLARFNYRSDVSETVATHLKHNKTKEVGDLKIEPGQREDSVLFYINQPKLWWCKGMGAQDMYDVKLEIKRAATLLDAAQTRTGLRTVELVQDKDAKGSTFFIRLNGKPVFCRGANYIPLEVFNDRATPEKYRAMLQNAEGANMNMLRVWGGGVYEDDLFYEQCDSMGIMVWQDFMYACALYPGNGAFLKNAAAEAYEQVVRLRKHPSIVLWCGNNENNEAWHNWGWQMNFTEEQRTRLWQHYKLIFNEILPTYVTNYADGVPYWESSPSYSRYNPKSLTEGDSHDWGVWHDEAPFSRYDTHVPRFMSEYGFQSFPNWSTIEKFALPEERYLDSKVMLLHQKHPKGNQLIATYMKRSYPVPKDFKRFVYVSQIVQADGMRTAIDAHRRNKPYCMGSLYWQLNDVWPVASWAGIDYDGNWKALHYAARNAFAPVAVIPELKSDELHVWVSADVPDTVHVTTRIKAVAFDGDAVFEQEIANIDVVNESARHVTAINIKEVLKGKRREQVFVVLSLHDVTTGAELHKRVVYLAEAKDMKLPSGKPEIDAQLIDNQLVVTLQSSKLVRSVQLNLPKAQHYSDNYFDLLPGEKKVVTIKPQAGAILDGKQLELLYLNMLD
jgi:beta-mannosidase